MKKTIITILTILIISTNIGLATAITQQKEDNYSLGGLEPYFLCDINSTGIGRCISNERHPSPNTTLIIDITYENDPNATTTITSLFGFREKTYTGKHRILAVYLKGEVDALLHGEDECIINGKAFYVAVQNLEE